jgi:hypothetical protein
MTLKARLSLLQSQAGSKPEIHAVPEARPRSPARSSRLATLRAGRVQAVPPKLSHRLSEEQLAEALNGTLLDTGLIRIESRLAFDERWGNTTLRVLDDIQRLPGETKCIPGVYIDTETTGLAGGSGTLAFLIGIAIIEEKSIKLTQLLMTRYAAESAMLSLFEQYLPSGQRFVSYNGKSYDIPLLRTRFRMQGLQATSLEREHLDLLHPTRRLFAKRWSDCRLATLEQELIGFYRKDDLPGSEAPEAWFNYLRFGYAQKLIKVVEHNRQDIISLAVAHAVLGMVINRPRFYRVDYYSLARWLCDSNESQAISLLETHRDALCQDGKRLLAHLFRRQNKWHAAVSIWEPLAQQGCIESIERLAKYHEHVSKDLLTAWHYCTQLPGSTADSQRLKRIEHKLTQLNIDLPGRCAS